MANIQHSLTRTIAIVGAGYSGTLCAVNLLRQCAGGGLRVILLDRHVRSGRGLAYRTWDDNFVLNVPAGNMSAFVDDSGHFVRYCHNIDPAFNSGSFVSRRIYGDYLESTLRQAAQACNGSVLEKIQADIISVRRKMDGEGFRIGFAGGNILDADQVVLALGHFAPLDPSPMPDFHRTSSYIGNPWDFAALDHIDDDQSVALLGAGHTAVDVLFRLTSRSDTRKIYLVSRRGLALQSHRFHPQSPVMTGFPQFLERAEPTVRQYFRALRQAAMASVAQGGDWRDVVNSLRPHTSEIWRRFSIPERRRFLTQVVAYWDVHRHRLAPVAHLRLDQMIKSGQAETIAGYVQGYQVDGDAVSMEIRQRHSGRVRKLTVGCVVNCTGPNCDITSIDAPLIVQLNSEGYVWQDPLKLGFEVDSRYQTINRDGCPIKNLFYIGPMLKACYWEAIAVPELRGHTHRLAEILSA